MDSVRTLGLSLLSWLADHPEFTVVMFSAVIWPVLTAVLTSASKRLEERAPNVAALLRAAGLDVPGVLRAIAALARRKVPAVPPPPPPAGGQ